MVGIMMMRKQSASNWWWLNGHFNAKRSPWLQSTLSELDKKTEAMLKMMEEDADSFAKRAEMYYKKRPELLSMVKDFYRTYRSLAESYDQIKSETQPRHLPSLGTPFSGEISHHEKPPITADYDSSYEVSDYDENTESEVEDPVEDGGSKAPEGETAPAPAPSPDPAKEAHVVRSAISDPRKEAHIVGSAIPNGVRTEEGEELRRLKKEIETLKEENRVQREQLKQKDEEKRGVIRQLSLAVGLLKEENDRLKKSVINETKKKDKPKVENDSNKMGDFLRKLFDGSFLSYQPSHRCGSVGVRKGLKPASL